MICPDCHGKGVFRIVEQDFYNVACTTCHGFGHVHCCEGDAQQPEPPGLPPRNLLDSAEPKAII